MNQDWSPVSPPRAWLTQHLVIPGATSPEGQCWIPYGPSPSGLGGNRVGGLQSPVHQICKARGSGASPQVVAAVSKGQRPCLFSSFLALPSRKVSST